MSILSYIERVWGGIEKLFEGLPLWLQTFITKVGSQEGTILTGLVDAAVADLTKDVTTPGQLTTANISAQAAAILAQLVAQNISTFTLQDVYSALNAALSSQLSPTETPSS